MHFWAGVGMPCNERSPVEHLHFLVDAKCHELRGGVGVLLPTAQWPERSRKLSAVGFITERVTRAQ